MRPNQLFSICFIVCAISMGIPSLYFYFYFTNLTDELKYEEQTCTITSTQFMSNVNNNIYIHYEAITNSKTHPQIVHACTTSASLLKFGSLDENFFQYGYQFQNNIMIWTCGHQTNSLAYGETFNCSVRSSSNFGGSDGVYMALFDLGDKVNNRPQWNILVIIMSLSSLIFLYLSILIYKKRQITIQSDQQNQNEIISNIYRIRYILLRISSDIFCWIILYFTLLSSCIKSNQSEQAICNIKNTGGPLFWVVLLHSLVLFCYICLGIVYFFIKCGKTTTELILYVLMTTICFVNLPLFISYFILSLVYSILFLIPVILSFFWYFIYMILRL
jgi:hypothetical protein